jgi:hypothetical protein
MYKIIGADQKEYGPISADQLRQWIAEGRVNTNTKVQPEGTQGWKTVGELPEFAASMPPVPPPPPPGVPGPVTMAPVAVKSNQTAVWAMISGIFGVVCCPIMGPVALVLGIIAHSQIKQNPQQTGSGFATTGIVLGIISLILTILGFVVFLSTPGLISNIQNQINQ